MSALLERRRNRDAIVLLPAALSSAGIGLGAAANPFVGVGVGTLTAASFIPWMGLFAVLVFSALANRLGYDVSGLTLRVAEAMLVPFAVRTWFLTRADVRPHLRLAEWLVIGWIGLNLLSSRFNSVLFKPSFLVAGVLGLGAIAYLTVSIGACTRERLITMTRIVLVATAFGAVVGMLAFAAHYAAGSNLGIDLRYQAQTGGAPSVSGLAYEHDLFGSTCAFGAIAFLVLLWDGDGRPLFKKRRSVMLGFWLCLIGMALSLARGAWIGFAITFVLLLILRRPRKHKPSKMERSALVLLVLGMAASGFIWASGQSTAGVESPVGVVGKAAAISIGYKVTTILDYRSGTGAGRIRKYSTAVQEMSQDPETVLVGMGTNSYGQRHFHPSRKPGPFVTPAYIESLYVRALYDTGIIGLALLLAFLGIVLWPFGAIRRWNGDLGAVARSLVFGWVAVGVAFAITDSTLLLWPWITLGLVRAARRLAHRQDQELGVSLAGAAQVELASVAPSGAAWTAGPGHNGQGAPG